MDTKLWCSQIEDRIETISKQLNWVDKWQFSTRLLARITKRIGEYSEQSCETCKTHQATIEKLVELLTQRAAGQRVDKEAYRSQLAILIKHLRKAHYLHEPGKFFGLGIGVMLLVGMVILGTSHPSYLLIVLFFGIVAGLGLEKKAMRADRVI